jgi:hypothetical protein
MLQNLLNVIEEKCEDGRFPEEFRGKIYSKSNFLDAYNQVELFSRDYNLNIPASIVPSLSHTSTSNSISLQPLNLQANTTFANNYEPRETLIQNLSFSQTNPKHYIESPQLRKYEPSERPQFVATSEMPRSAPFSQIDSLSHRSRRSNPASSCNIPRNTSPPSPCSRARLNSISSPKAQ